MKLTCRFNYDDLFPKNDDFRFGLEKGKFNTC